MKEGYCLWDAMEGSFCLRKEREVGFHRKEDMIKDFFRCRRSR